MKVEDLTLIRQIGEGSFGEVYLTQREKSQTLLASKKIKKTYVYENNLQKYLKNELSILKKVKHPNIIKFIETKETNNHIYIVFEHCNGGTLTNYMLNFKSLYNSPLPEDIVQPLFKQMTEGLLYLHKKKILHRDLKPDNILLNFPIEGLKSNRMNPEEAEVKIIDFGFARYLKEDDLATSTLGSPLQMDPRILKKMKKIEGFKFCGYKEDIDIWSLGCILYEMLIGFPPFNAQTYEELINKLGHGYYNIPTKLKLSKQAISLINGMLQQDPNARLNILEVSEHDFLTKKTSEFDYLDLKKTKKIDILSKSQGNYVLDTKQKNIWFFYEENETKDGLTSIVAEHDERTSEKLDELQDKIDIEEDGK